MPWRELGEQAGGSSTRSSSRTPRVAPRTHSACPLMAACSRSTSTASHLATAIITREGALKEPPHWQLILGFSWFRLGSCLNRTLVFSNCKPVTRCARIRGRSVLGSGFANAGSLAPMPVLWWSWPFVWRAWNWHLFPVTCSETMTALISKN